MTFTLELVSFPRDATTPVDARATYRNIVAGRMRRAFARVITQADANTPFPKLQGGYEIHQDTGGSSIEMWATNHIDIWPFVEYDTKPHDIPGAWGIPAPFGIGGRFDGKFHPGTKGQHFFGRAWEDGGEEAVMQAAAEATAAWLSRWGNDVSD